MTTDTIDQTAVDAFVAAVPADATPEQFAAVIKRMRAIRPNGPRPKGPNGYVNYATVIAAADRLQGMVDAR